MSMKEKAIYLNECVNKGIADIKAKNFTDAKENITEAKQYFSMLITEMEKHISESK